MNYDEFLRQLDSPVAGAVLKKWPQGHITQLWAENPKLYSSAANRNDDFHTHFGGHMGIDIAGVHRTPILAAHDGFVAIAHGERTRQGGLELWLESDSYNDKGIPAKVRTVYSHLDEWIVKPGERVSKGQKIAYMGNTGFVVSGGTPFWGDAPAGKGTHLHFGLYEHVQRDVQAGQGVVQVWQPRYVNVLRNSSDPLPYISETPENPHGNLSGLAVLLGNMKAYLSRSA